MLRILLVLAALILSPGAWAGSKSVPAVEGWGRVEDPDGDCTISVKDGRVKFLVPGGEHDLSPVLGKVNAPRILQEIDGNFSVQVKVSSSVKPEIGSFRSGTLLIWQDEKNFIRLDSACAALGDSTLDFFCHLHVFKDGKRLVNEQIRPLKDEPTHLRLERRGAKVTASFSQHGIGKWRSFTEQKADLPRKLKVGVAVLNGTRSPFTLVLENLLVGRDVGDARAYPRDGLHRVVLE